MHLGQALCSLSAFLECDQSAQSIVSLQQTQVMLSSDNVGKLRPHDGSTLYSNTLRESTIYSAWNGCVLATGGMIVHISHECMAG